MRNQKKMNFQTCSYKSWLDIKTYLKSSVSICAIGLVWRFVIATLIRQETKLLFLPEKR